MSDKNQTHIASDREDSGSTSHGLPPLHQVLGDVFLQCTSSEGSPDSVTSRPRQGSLHPAPTPWFLRSHPVFHQAHGFGGRGPQLAPISPSRSSPPRSLASTPSPEGSPSSQRLRSISSSTAPSDPYPPAQATLAHSYDLFNLSFDHGLVHQKSSKSQDDLEESRPKPRTSAVDNTSRKYICFECGKRFAKPSTLRNHIMTHTGEKPFACPHPHCGRRFSMASNMQRHIRTHTSGSAFEIVPSGGDEESSGDKTSAGE